MAAATDDVATPDKLVYEVYQAETAGAQDFTLPPLRTTAPGATSVTLTDLLGDSSLHWVVRARDLGNNLDTNRAEQSAMTQLSFSSNIQRIFTYNCAVVGCHIPGNPPAGLVLAKGFSFLQIVGVPAAEFPSLSRVSPTAPDNSYLYQKVEGTAARGTQMPAPATGNVLTEVDKDRLRRWILNGALQN